MFSRSTSLMRACQPVKLYRHDPETDIAMAVPDGEIDRFVSAVLAQGAYAIGAK